MGVERTVVLPRKSNKTSPQRFQLFFLACKVAFRATIVTKRAWMYPEDSLFLNGTYVSICYLSVAEVKSPACEEAALHSQVAIKYFTLLCY